MERLGITIDEFKRFFQSDFAGSFQPFPLWTRTLPMAGDVVSHNGYYWQSKEDSNMEEPGGGLNSLIDSLDGTDFFQDSLEAGAEALVNSLDNPEDGSWIRLGLVEDLADSYPDAWDWVLPIAYNTGDKVVGIVNFTPGVYISAIDDNFYDPAKPNIIPKPDSNPLLAWEISEDDPIDFILDSNIERAMMEAAMKFNPSLLRNEENKKLVALYMTAFFLVYDKQLGGLNGGNGASGPVTQRQVGDMKVKYMESKLLQNHPSLEFFLANGYGRKVANLLLPYLMGNVAVLRGGSTSD